jgi:Zn-dependent M28 family amino/carboxypeptidase
MRLPVTTIALLLAAAPATAFGQTAPAEPTFSPDEVRKHVEFLASDALEGRFTLSKGYLNAAAYVAQRFLELGLQPGGPDEGWFQLVPISLTEGALSIKRTYKSPNVIGILPGSDPVLKNEFVVLSAHLDHVGTDPKQGSDKIFNGAMDNAAGVSTMLEAARAFVTSGKRPRRSIMFVALAGEEMGLLGSSYLARNPVTGTGKVVADVNLDMPILLYDFQDVIAFGGEHSTMGEITARAGAKMGVTLSPDPMPDEGFFERSDHFSFVKAGVPSIFLMTGFKNGGEKAFRGFLKKNYHQVSDQADLPFDWNAGAKFARLNYMIAREVADADEAPRWYQGNKYGERYAKGAPKAPRPARTAAAQ